MSYENLPFIVWIIFFGVCAASFYAYYQRQLLGNIVRAIIANEAIDPDSAKTLNELGYGKGSKNSFARFALRKGSGLRKTVEAVYEEKSPSKKHRDQLFVRAQKVDTEQKYYIPEEKRIVAEVRYEGKGTSLKTLIVSIVALFVAALLVIKFLPWVMDKVRYGFGTNHEEETVYEQDVIYDGNEYEETEVTETQDTPESAEGSGDLKGIVNDADTSDIEEQNGFNGEEQ